LIDTTVQQIAFSFKEKWNNHLQAAPVLLLDDTWPSVGTLDLLTFGLRLESNLSKDEESLVKGASAYLALLVHKCWSLIADKVRVDNSEEGITVTAQNGPALIENDQASVNVEVELRKCLQELPYPFPVIADLTRPISFDSNIICPFAIGLLTGLSPTVRGPWSIMPPKSFMPFLDVITKELARQSAEYYTRVYPQEPLGQVAEMYLSNLVFPPAMIGEVLPASNAVHKLLDFFTEYKISREAMQDVAHNLALSADDLLSYAGLALFAALADEMPPKEIIAAAQAKGRQMGLLRRTMLSVRKRLELGPDWVEDGLKHDRDKKHFDIETSLEFIPWLYLSRKRVEADAEDGKLAPLLAALCDFDMPTATRTLDKLIEEDPTDIECRLQRAKLEMLSGNNDQADSLCSAIYSEPNADSNPRFFNLWGLCALKVGDVPAALKYLKAGLALQNAGPWLKSDIANNLGWAYILKGDFEAALEHLEKGLQESECPTTLLLNKAYALWQLKRREESLDVRKELFQLAPTDRRVFGNIALS
jgi:tetratricopeptide (TPR) repeat protein